MASVTTRINLTGNLAIAVEEEARHASDQEGRFISQAEIVRRVFTQAWGEDLSQRPSMHRPCTADGASVNRSTVQPVIGKTPTADDLFSSSP